MFTTAVFTSLNVLAFMFVLVLRVGARRAHLAIRFLLSKPLQAHIQMLMLRKKQIEHTI